MKTTLLDILIPRLSERIIDCQVARWLKNEGDYVMEGEVIVELETEKTTIEIESPCDGTLSGIYVFEGEEVIDGERVGVINAVEVFGDIDDDEDDEDDDLEEEDFGEDIDEDEDFDDDEYLDEELEELENEEEVYNKYSGVKD